MAPQISLLIFFFGHDGDHFHAPRARSEAIESALNALISAARQQNVYPEYLITSTMTAIEGFNTDIIGTIQSFTDYLNNIGYNYPAMTQSIMLNNMENSQVRIQAVLQQQEAQQIQEDNQQIENQGFNYPTQSQVLTQSRVQQIPQQQAQQMEIQQQMQQQQSAANEESQESQEENTDIYGGSFLTDMFQDGIHLIQDGLNALKVSIQEYFIK